MELWIRSQDKMELRPNPKLAIEVLQENYYITDRYEFDKSNILGEYKTKERALEILDEIQDIMTFDKNDYVGQNKVSYQQCNMYKSDILMLYEMPQE